MAVRAARLIVDIDSNVTGALAGIDRVAYRMGTLGRAGFGTAQTMARLGGTLTGVGFALGAAGAIGLKFFAESTRAAVEYNRQAALTLTQTQGLGLSLEQVAQTGRNVAKEIPVPFEQVQQGLYDIFSSLDVGVKESEQILKGFSKGAVAGQTDIQTAGRATIALMNSFGLSSRDLNHLLDVQFQLVAKGVGTYDEFAKVIGRAIPSARKAGQSIESLAGVMAFLTRNGLSTAMASTSAARAFDSLAHPKVIARLKKMGISALDSAGQFRAIGDVSEELGKKLSNLTDAGRAKELQELFKGAGGTIQAQRFWNLAIRNYDELQERVGQMVNSKGALESAYKTMFDTPAMQMQLFQNNMQLLREEIGRQFLPHINKLVEFGIKLIDMFRRLQPETKEMIVKTIAIATALATISGIIFVVAGGFLSLTSAISMVTGAGGLLSSMLATGLLGGLVALPFAIYKIVENWDILASRTEHAREKLENIKKIFGEVADSIGSTIRGIKGIFDKEGLIGIIDRVPEILKSFKEAFTSRWPAIKEEITKALFGEWSFEMPRNVKVGGMQEFAGHSFTPGLLSGITNAIKGADWQGIGAALWGAFDRLIDSINFVPTAKKLGVKINEFFSNHDWEGTGRALGKGIQKLFVGLATIANKIADGFFSLLRSIDWFEIGAKATGFVIQLVLGFATGLVRGDWMGPIGETLKKHWFTMLMAVLSFAFTPAEWVGKIIGLVAKIPIIGTLLGWLIKSFHGIARGALSAVGNILAKVLPRAFGKLGGSFSKMFSFMDQLNLGSIVGKLGQLGKNMATSIGNGFLNIKPIKWVTTLIDDMIVALGKGFKNAGSSMVEASKNLFSPITNRIRIVGDEIANGLWYLKERFLGFFVDAKNWLLGKADLIFHPIKEGARIIIEDIGNWLWRFKEKILGWFADSKAWLLGKADQVFGPVIDGARNILNAIGGFLWGIKEKIASFFSTAPNWIYQTARSIFDPIINGAKSVLGNVGTWLTGIKSKITGFFSGAGDWLYDMGTKIMDGLRRGIQTGGEHFKRVWNGIIEAIPGDFANFLKIKSPSRMFMGYGEMIVLGLQKGLHNQLPSLRKEMNSLGASINGPTIQHAIKPDMKYSSPVPMIPGAGIEVSTPNSTSVTNNNVTIQGRFDSAEELLSRLDWQMRFRG